MAAASHSSGTDLAVSVELTPTQIEAYGRDGFVYLPGFLTPEQLEDWRSIVDEAVDERFGQRFDTDRKDQTNVDSAYYDRVFDQRVNLFRTSPRVAELWRQAGPGINEAVLKLEAAATAHYLADGLGGVADAAQTPECMRIWHDQALIKRPWANPTGFHNDNPYWSFESAHAASLWVALDDATLCNGTLHMVPGSHRAILGSSRPFHETKISKNVGSMLLDDHADVIGTMEAAPIEYKAGDASIHNGLTAHGAGPNFTPHSRRAMTLQMMPARATFAGKQNILTAERFASLKVGDALADEEMNPRLASE